MAARAGPLGRLPFGMGPRFFVALLSGFLWLVPAWWIPQLIAAMLLWDLLAVVAFVSDLLRMPSRNRLRRCVRGNTPLC